VSNKRPGRPPNGLTEYFRAKICSLVAAEKIGVKTGYGLEKYFKNEIFPINQSDISRSCLYDKHMRGESVPSLKTINKQKIDVPDIERVRNHPFWEIIKPSKNSADKIQIQLNRLRPDIVKILFFNTRNTSVFKEVFKSTFTETKPLFESLIIEGDWDATTACFGLIHKARLEGKTTNQTMSMYYGHGILRRFLSTPPFSKIAVELYEYLSENFLIYPDDHEWNQKIRTTDMEEWIDIYNLLRLVITELNILKHHNSVVPASLYLAENYLTPLFLDTAKKFRASVVGKKELRKLKEVRNMTRQIQRWEQKFIAKQSS
jgi:hypothetical protein